MNQEYEYIIDAVQDEWKGGSNLSKLQEVLDRRAKAGWRLVTAHTNELGKNAVSVSGFGVNSTADQTILIFERPVTKKIEIPSNIKVYTNTNQAHSTVSVKTINIDKKDIGNKIYISAAGTLYKKCNISAMKLNVTFESYWGDSKSLCLIFDDIVIDIQNSFKTEFIEINPEVTKSLKTIYAEVQQYVEDESLNNNEIIDCQTNEFNILDYFDTIKEMQNVRSMKEFFMELQINDLDFLTIILPKMDELIGTERIYGTMKESFLKWLKDNYMEY